MRDRDDEALTRYDYERGSVPTRDGMSEDQTPIRGVVSIFSDNKKRGRWELPRHMRVLAIFGSATIDLREATVGPGVSVIEALTIFGNIEIVVPPEINVQCDGDAIMGEFAIKRSKRDEATLPPPDPGAPFVRIIGSAYMASVAVKVKSVKKKPSGRALLGGYS